MIASIVANALFALSTVPFFAAVRDCAPGNSVFEVNSVSLEPPTPVSGQNLTLFLDYTVPDGVLITDGTAEYDITYNYIPFTPSTEPLCQNIPCPLGPGRYQNSSTSVWPQDLSGLLVTELKWYDPAQNLLLCVEISGQVGDLREVALAMTETL